MIFFSRLFLFRSVVFSNSNKQTIVIKPDILYIVQVSNEYIYQHTRHVINACNPVTKMWLIRSREDMIIWYSLYHSGVARIRVDGVFHEIFDKNK